MNSAYAHTTVYPHQHPHAEISKRNDNTAAALWLSFLCVIAFTCIAIFAKRRGDGVKGALEYVWLKINGRR